jgi:hypothetical protein
MNKAHIHFISASPTRSGTQVQARFRVTELVPGCVSNQSYIRSWTLTLEQVEVWRNNPGATTAMISWLLRYMRVIGNPRDCAGECKRALAALHDAATGRAAQARQQHELAQAESAVRARVLRALQLGVSDDRVREIVKECLVRNVMEA